MIGKKPVYADILPWKYNLMNSSIKRGLKRGMLFHSSPLNVSVRDSRLIHSGMTDVDKLKRRDCHVAPLLAK